MRHVELPGGEKVPALGLGTWHMGERKGEKGREVAALKLGLDLGLKLIDTAEMYGEGGAEEVVAAAVEGRRDDVFIVSKVYPHNASLRGTIAACERSLKRLGTDRIDLYLLHWRGSYPLSETVDVFERLKRDGKIRHWGVSNLDTEEMDELVAVKNGNRCAANQVLYHLGSRGIEHELQPWCRARKMPIMAYCPLGQGPLVKKPAIQAIAKARGVPAAAVALAWTMRGGDVIAIPKSSSLEHTRENAAAADLVLSDEEFAALDKAFPPPSAPTPLAIL